MNTEIPIKFFVSVSKDFNDSLQAGWSGDRILVGARLSAPVQTSSGAHPASYTVDTRSLPRGKLARAWY